VAKLNATNPGRTLENAGVPSAGTSEVQTLTVTGSPTGGSFKLKFRDRMTASIAYNADAAAIQSALEALSTIGTGNVAVTGTGPFTLTFQAAKGKQALPNVTLAVNALTGGSSPSVTCVEATPGVDATFRGAGKGSLLKDTTNGKLYINTGTTTAPTWTVVGTQT
jgi:hypothetical protein